MDTPSFFVGKRWVSNGALVTSCWQIAKSKLEMRRLTPESLQEIPLTPKDTTKHYKYRLMDAPMPFLLCSN